MPSAIYSLPRGDVLAGVASIVYSALACGERSARDLPLDVRSIARMDRSVRHHGSLGVILKQQTTPGSWIESVAGKLCDPQAKCATESAAQEWRQRRASAHRIVQSFGDAAVQRSWTCVNVCITRRADCSRMLCSRKCPAATPPPMAQKAAKPTSTEVLLVAIDMTRTQVRVSRCEPRLATAPCVRVAVNEDRQTGGHRHRRLDAIGAKNHKYAKICQNLSK